LKNLKHPLHVEFLRGWGFGKTKFTDMFVDEMRQESLRRKSTLEEEASVGCASRIE